MNSIKLDYDTLLAFDFNQSFILYNIKYKHIRKINDTKQKPKLQ